MQEVNGDRFPRWRGQVGLKRCELIGALEVQEFLVAQVERHGVVIEATFEAKLLFGGKGCCG